MVLHFFLLISLAGTWNNRDLYNYNIVYPAYKGASIQYFSNQTPEKFSAKVVARHFQNFEHSKLRLMAFPYPSGYYFTEYERGFDDSYNALTRVQSLQDRKVNIKSITNRKQSDCVKELERANTHGAVSLTSIMDGNLQHCKVNLLIDLIHSKKVIIRESVSDCKCEKQRPCIVRDRTVPAPAIADDFRALASAEKNGKRAYLVTVAGELKIILQQSRSQYIIMPKLGDKESDDIFQFMVMISKHRVPSVAKILESDVVDLYISATDEGVNLYRSFLHDSN